MKTELIKEAFNNFNKANILVIGDVMIDSYLWGKVDRISPEAPVPVVSAKKYEKRLGGAANVALNIKALEATPILCSIIGEDTAGNDFLEILRELQLPEIGIIRSSSRITTIKTRIISGNQHLLRIDEEITSNLNTEDELNFIAQIKSIISTKQVSAIIFEDYDKGCITQNVINEIVTTANEKKIPTLVDPKKRNFSNYVGVSLFKPNFKELIEGLKISIKKTDTDALQQAAKVLLKQQGIENVLITLSEAGVFISNGTEHHAFPAKMRDIADVSGAGDTVISTASLCLVSGMQLSDIAQIVNIAGGIVCEKTGVVPINKTQLLSECIEHFEKSDN